MFKLLSTSGEHSIDLQLGRKLVVGRAVTSDVPIYDESISRRHAEIVLTETGVRVKDLGSLNGTFLNGAKVTEAEAGPNDVVTFGGVAFRVKDVTVPMPRPQIVPHPPEFSPAPGGKRGAAAGTIVRQMPVSISGGVPAIVIDEPQGASHLKVKAANLVERREKKLSLLLEISKELSKQQELDRLLDKVVEILFQIMNADRVSILLLDGTELVPRISRSPKGDASAANHVPQSIARKAIEERVAILSDNPPTDERFKGKSIMIQRVRSAMCTPLMGSDANVLGILYVDNQTDTHSFADEDLEFLIAFANLTAVAIENSQLSARLRREKAGD